ncbi:AraC family transcriptional regulator [Sunxiuqinia elliptica]|nr:AraC family transcriptional regulator [Sunxiuqinia elliptica]
MTNKDLVYKAVCFMEDHLQAELDVMTVANEVCYSLYHFIRLFQHTTGFSPKSYLQKRRLTEALHELQTTDKKIADIAYDFQFGSPESFTRAFRKQFNLSPSKVRNGASVFTLPLLQPLSADQIFGTAHSNASPPLEIELPELLLAGTSFFAAEDAYPNDLSNQWNQFMAEHHQLKTAGNEQHFIQLQYWSDIQDLGGMYFFIGAEIAQLAGLPPYFVVKQIPAGKYLRFTHRGLSNAVGYTYRYIYHQYLPDTDYRLNKPFNFERYGDQYLGPYNEQSESEIYIPVD